MIQKYGLDARRQDFCPQNGVCCLSECLEIKLILIFFIGVKSIQSLLKEDGLNYEQQNIHYENDFAKDHLALVNDRYDSWRFKKDVDESPVKGKIDHVE